ncbi:hypothetical protein [Corynebacterium hadale]|uniref:hypothetical protein n=1 Tax=Corynebacterium hadale TaxID=2026255 RepID=UPI0010544495|nr:hypothetical protein [Corynebacterium hadale]
MSEEQGLPHTIRRVIRGIHSISDDFGRQFLLKSYGRAQRSLGTADPRLGGGSALPRESTNYRFFSAHKSFGSIADFLRQKRPVKHFTVWEKGLPIDCSFNLQKGAPLVTVFHGAAAESVRLPFLSGAGVTAELESSVLSISDPSLYLDPALNLAWFAGSSIQDDLPMTISQIIRKLATTSGAKKLIFLGGSGGGFASLNMLGYFPTATAIVMNPQTDIDRYHRPSVNRYIKFAWRNDTSLYTEKCNRSVFMSTDIASRAGGRVFYLQNSNDIFHIKNHLEPFKKRHEGVENFRILVDAWKAGHTPPPKELTRQVLDSVVSERNGEGVHHLFRPL